MQFLDFTAASMGLLVKRSAHQRRELSMTDDEADQFGIMVDREFVEEQGRVVCYPVIHWEGSPTHHLCHPINLEPVRPHALRWIEHP